MRQATGARSRTALHTAPGARARTCSSCGLAGGPPASPRSRRAASAVAARRRAERSGSVMQLMLRCAWRAHGMCMHARGGDGGGERCTCPDARLRCAASGGPWRRMAVRCAARREAVGVPRACSARQTHGMAPHLHANEVGLDVRAASSRLLSWRRPGRGRGARRAAPAAAHRRPGLPAAARAAAGHAQGRGHRRLGGRRPVLGQDACARRDPGQAHAGDPCRRGVAQHGARTAVELAPNVLDAALRPRGAIHGAQSVDIHRH